MPPMIHPLWLRMTHWGNALAVAMLTASGWRIYNASPFFDFTFPRGITLGGWLGGALLWHFAAMWLLVANGLIYLAANLATGRLRRRFCPLRLGQVWHDLLQTFKGKLAHDDPANYNAVQRTAYLFVIADIVLIFLSGLVLWKSVQFPLLRELMGGYETARRVHFVGMAALVGFVAVHIVMAGLVPRTLRAMFRGR
jgi:thiosulfate reductase cytochrome b subunit